MLNELTNKIKKIIPEIEELKFGCKIGCEDGYFIIGTSDIEISYIHKGTENEVRYYEAGFGRKETTKDNFEIIGRDITLEDVLRCLKSDYYINEDGYLYEIISENEDGGIYLEMVSPGIHWLLGKPLHEQSEETIKELNKLI